MRLKIAPIVEGHGEVYAVPLLLRRLVPAIDASVEVEVFHPIRTARSKLMQPGEMERAVQLAAAKLGGNGAVLILLDADDDCPAVLGPQLLARAHSARTDIPCTIVLANREYESWFIAAADSLRGVRGVPDDQEIPNHPEGIRGAKEWLKDRMGRYSETADQPALSARFDLQSARRSPSFDKLWREVEHLIAVAAE